MRRYYKLRLGEGAAYANECFTGNFVGVNFGINQDLTDKLPEKWRAFNHAFIPVYLEARPERTRIAAGLACGSLWTVCKGMRDGDIVLCPDGNGSYHAGEIAGGYYFAPEKILPHRRPTRWLSARIDQDQMSEGLRRAAANPLTVCTVSGYASEIEKLIAEGPGAPPAEEGIEDISAFAMEKHLEDFLVENWAQTELGEKFDIYKEEGQPVGQQYPTDTGPLDILAVSKDKKSLLVVELKKGRASDAVVGQTLRYMGYVKDELADQDQTVQGIIIALEDDLRIRRALTAVPNVKFYRYKINFELIGTSILSQREFLTLLVFASYLRA